MIGQTRQRKQAPTWDECQRAADTVGVVFTSYVIVGHDDDVDGATEMPGVFGSPVARAASVAGGDQPPLAQCFSFVLALADVDCLFVSDSLEQLRQTKRQIGQPPSGFFQPPFSPPTHHCGYFLITLPWSAGL